MGGIGGPSARTRVRRLDVDVSHCRIAVHKENRKHRLASSDDATNNLELHQGSKQS